MVGMIRRGLRGWWPSWSDLCESVFVTRWSTFLWKGFTHDDVQQCRHPRVSDHCALQLFNPI